MLIKLINICLEKNIPFVSFRLPNVDTIQTWVQLSGKFNLYESFRDVAEKEGFVYAPFHRITNYPVIFFEPETILIDDNFEESLIEEISGNPPLYPNYSYKTQIEISRKNYLKQIESLVESFDRHLQKAVLSRVHIEQKPRNFNTGKYFWELQKSYPGAFCHLINIPGTGTWTGASPETLLSINEKTAETISLAGTQAYSATNKKISWHDKEIAEQQIVTNYIEDIFRKFEITDYQKEKLQNLIAGSVVHLASKFSFDRKFIENRLADFVDELHPTPAVCGLPKSKALDQIQLTEQHNREYYAGFMGTMNMKKRSDLFVNLRCMKILPDKLAMFTGGGLTKDSIGQKEWEETCLKKQTLTKLL